MPIANTLHTNFDGWDYNVRTVFCSTYLDAQNAEYFTQDCILNVKLKVYVSLA